MLSNNDSKAKRGPMSVYSLFSLTIFFADVTADVFRPSQSDPRTCYRRHKIQGGSNMTGTDLYVNKPHCAAAVRP